MVKGERTFGQREIIQVKNAYFTLIFIDLYWLRQRLVLKEFNLKEEVSLK